MGDESQVWVRHLDGREPAFTALAWARTPQPSRHERASSWATKPIWSPDGRLLWFHVAHRKRVTPDPERVRRDAEATLRGVPEERREAVRETVHADSRRRLEWEATVWHGFFDLTERQVCLQHWGRRVAWSPRLEAPME